MSLVVKSYQHQAGYLYCHRGWHINHWMWWRLTGTDIWQLQLCWMKSSCGLDAKQTTFKTSIGTEVCVYFNLYSCVCTKWQMCSAFLFTIFLPSPFLNYTHCNVPVCTHAQPHVHKQPFSASLCAHAHTHTHTHTHPYIPVCAHVWGRLLQQSTPWHLHPLTTLSFFHCMVGSACPVMAAVQFSVIFSPL